MNNFSSGPNLPCPLVWQQTGDRTLGALVQSGLLEWAQKEHVHLVSYAPVVLDCGCTHSLCPLCRHFIVQSQSLFLYFFTALYASPWFFTFTFHGTLTVPVPMYLHVIVCEASVHILNRNKNFGLCNTLMLNLLSWMSASCMDKKHTHFLLPFICCLRSFSSICSLKSIFILICSFHFFLSHFYLPLHTASDTYQEVFCLSVQMWTHTTHPQGTGTRM